MPASTRLPRPQATYPNPSNAHALTGHRAQEHHPIIERDLREVPSPDRECLRGIVHFPEVLREQQQHLHGHEKSVLVVGREEDAEMVEVEGTQFTREEGQLVREHAGDASASARREIIAIQIGINFPLVSHAMMTAG